MRYLLIAAIVLTLISCRQDSGINPIGTEYRLLRADYLMGADTIFLASWEYRPDGRLDREHYTNRLTSVPQVQTIEYTYFADSVLAVSTTETATDVIVIRYTIFFNAQKLVTAVRSYNESTTSTILYTFDRDVSGRITSIASSALSFIFSDRFIYSGNTLTQYSRYFPSLITPGKTDTVDMLLAYDSGVPYQKVISPVEVLPFTTPSPYHQPFSLELCGLKTNPDPTHLLSSIDYVQLFGSDITVTFDYTIDETGKVVSKTIETTNLPGMPFTAYYVYEEM